MLGQLLDFVGSEDLGDLVGVDGEVLPGADPRRGLAGEPFGGELLDEALEAAGLIDEGGDEGEELVGLSAGAARGVTECAKCLSCDLIEESHGSWLVGFGCIGTNGGNLNAWAVRSQMGDWRCGERCELAGGG